VGLLGLEFLRTKAELLIIGAEQKNKGIENRAGEVLFSGRRGSWGALLGRAGMMPGTRTPSQGFGGKREKDRAENLRITRPRARKEEGSG